MAGVLERAPVINGIINDRICYERTSSNGVWKRYLGWITVSLLVAFLTNNFLNIYFGFKGLSSLFTGFSVTGSATLLIYIVFTVIGILVRK